MEKEKIEKLKKFAKETLENIFYSSDEDFTSLRNEFRKNTKITDLSIANSFIIIHKKHLQYPDNSTEAKIKLVDKIKGEIGYFSLIWDEDNNLLDDFFILY